MSNICILFQQFAELFYTSYMCIFFLAARRPVVHDAYAYLFQLYTDLLYMLCICIPFSAVRRPVLHVIHMHTFFRRTPTCSTCYTYAYPFQPEADLFYMSYRVCISFFSQRPICSTCHAYAYLFHPEAEVKEGVAGVCERCVR